MEIPLRIMHLEDCSYLNVNEICVGYFMRLMRLSIVVMSPLPLPTVCEFDLGLICCWEVRERCREQFTQWIEFCSKWELHIPCSIQLFWILNIVFPFLLWRHIFSGCLPFCQNNVGTGINGFLFCVLCVSPRCIRKVTSRQHFPDVFPPFITGNLASCRMRFG